VIQPVLPWDLFRIAEQLGEGYGKWIQWQGVEIAPGVTVLASYDVPQTEVWWLTNCACSNFPINAVRFTFWVDGTPHPGMKDIIVDESMLGKPLCPPGEMRINRVIVPEVENISDHTIFVYGLIFIRVISKWLVELWDAKTRHLLDELRRA